LQDITIVLLFSGDQIDEISLTREHTVSEDLADRLAEYWPHLADLDGPQGLKGICRSAVADGRALGLRQDASLARLANLRLDGRPEFPKDDHVSTEILRDQSVPEAERLDAVWRRVLTG
jgi:hypothetical protein